MYLLGFFFFSLFLTGKAYAKGHKQLNIHT